MKKSTALKQENTPSQEAIVVGGIGDHHVELPEDAVAWANFFGCISNVQVRTADKKVYRPLEDYNTHANNSEGFTRVGLPHRTQCSAFKPPYSEVEEVVVNIKSKAEMREVVKENFQPLQQEEVPYNDGSGIKMAGKIGGLIVGVVSLSVFIYLCKITHSEPKTTTNEIGLIETKIVTDTENPPTNTDKEKLPLLAESVEMEEVKSGDSGTGVSVKYEKETAQVTKSEPPNAAKTAPEAVSAKEKQEGSIVPPALIVVEKPTDESVPINAEVQKAREALDLLDPKDLEKSNTKLSESCEDVSETEETKDQKVDGSEDATEVNEAIDTALDAEETKKSETQ